MKKGFTLIEMLVVVAILATASVLIGTNFFGLIGNADEYEKENLYKYLNEAACVYVDSNDYKDKAGKTIDGTVYPDCNDECYLKSAWLYFDGYIDENAGLLKSYTEEEIKNYEIKVTWNEGEKKCCVVGGDC